MFKHIIARTPARSLVDGLTSSHLGKPDYAKALEQHNAYIRALQTCDVDITLLPPDERFPDSVFVEDPVLCTSRCAIITRPGAESRRGETEIIEETVQRFYPGKVERIEAPGTVEAGDIMMVGDHFYIGESAPHQRRGRPADDRDPGETWPQRLGGTPGKGPAPEDRARLPGTQQPAGRRRVRQQAGVPGLQHHRDPRRGVLRRQLHLGQRKGDHARRLSPDPRRSPASATG